MKQVTKQRTYSSDYTVWEANDGSEFYSREECEKYEKSALGVARDKLKKLIVTVKENAWDIMGGMDDHSVASVLLKEEKDINDFMLWLYTECPWYLDDNHKERKEEIVKTVRKAFEEEDILFLGINTENEYYFINSCNNIIHNFAALHIKEEKK